MKRMFSLFLAAALLLASLPGCRKTAQQSEPPERQLVASEAVNAMLAVSGHNGQSGNLEYLTAGEDGSELLAAYLENAYGLLDGAWEDAAVIRATGASAFELAVLRLEDVDEAVLASVLLISYLSSRQGDFAGYAPEQADLVANGSVAQSGSYTALCICPNTDQATAAFTAAVSGNSQAEPEQPSLMVDVETLEPEYVPDHPGRIPFVRPNQDDMSIYDTSAILAAWENGDPTELSSYDREIYYAAQEMLSTVLSDGMNDLEKEIAVYHWIVVNVNYDWTHTDVLRETPRESFTPYGGLVNHTAVCLGYATTFQLLMDLIGVECVTVIGASNSSQEDHGWNMVRLNGNWYCVDSTWDANYREYGYTRGQERDWSYFNITSDEMAWSDHQWDYTNVPEAVTWGNGRG